MQLSPSYNYTSNILYQTKLPGRSTHAVKHFKVGVEGGSLLLGQERFDGLDSFLEHFDKHPMIGDETGIATLYSCIYLLLSQQTKN